MEQQIQSVVVKEVLGMLAERLVVKKTELIGFLEGKVENPRASAVVLAQTLSTQGLITYVTAIGESSIAITKRGIREAEK